MKNLLNSKFIQFQHLKLKKFNNLFFFENFKNYQLIFFLLNLLNTQKKKFQNKLIGIKLPYLKRLILSGVGFRIEKQLNNLLQLRLGYSHFIYLMCPPQINFLFSKKKILILKSNDLELLSLFVSQLKKLKKFDKYKGKGFLNKNTNIILKVGKKKK